MSIVINPVSRLVVAQGVTADVVLQPGTVVNAQVQQLLGNDHVRIAIGGQSIDVVSQVPLQAGQTLQLTVSQTADGNINLAVVNSPGATRVSLVAPQDQLTQLQALAVQSLAVSVAAQAAATEQASLAPLFANLSVAAVATALPPPVQQAAAQLLTQRTSLDQGLTGDDIKQAFQKSGLFLEASLASGSFSSATTPDLKAALIVLRQVLTTALSNATTVPATTPATSSATTTAASTAAPSGSPPATVPMEAGAVLLQEVLSQLSPTPAATVVAGDASGLDDIACARAAADARDIGARRCASSRRSGRRAKRRRVQCREPCCDTCRDTGGRGGARCRRQRGPQSAAGGRSGKFTDKPTDQSADLSQSVKAQLPTMP